MATREGNLEPPKREPIDWQNEAFYDKQELFGELERVFDICHGCRRCVNLCESFPTLFDLVDESATFEVDGVSKDDYMNVVDQCFMCDLCAETKCPYLPPHEWAVDFPHLMLRAKAYKFRNKDTKWRDRLITSTDRLFTTLGTPGVASVVNAANSTSLLRGAVHSTLGIHRDAPVPEFATPALSRREVARTTPAAPEAVGCDRTTGKVAVFSTCYGENTDPGMVEDLVAVLRHNGITVKLLQDVRCCGMPKLELGDLNSVATLKNANVPAFLQAIADGYDLLSPIPSCVLMYKQELPLMFPDDTDVATVRGAFFDPFEYLSLRNKAGLLNTDFTTSLGKVAYHVACHQRVQSIGPRTREILQLVPETEVTNIERCSGHDGTYALKSETYDNAMKIARPVVRRVAELEPDTYGSDCPMAGRMIQHGLQQRSDAPANPAEVAASVHPISMLRRAYGI